MIAIVNTFGEAYLLWFLTEQKTLVKSQFTEDTADN
jgi:hypothetical protein